MMKKMVLTFMLAFVGLASFAQTTQQEFLDRYTRLTKNVGTAGVGVETLLSRWEEAFPDDSDMLSAAFIYYYEKCQNTVTVSKPSPTYLGQKPLLTLKDSLGANVNYFYDTEFDDEMFGKAQQYIDKVNQMFPLKLDNRCAAVTALINYEKDSPDMALSRLREIVGFNYSSKPEWTYDDQPIDEETFRSMMQEYCYSFFRLASPSGYEAFRILSEDMLKYNPSDVLFLDNIGSYYLVGKDDPKTALKYYNKVLKIQADDITAIKNGVILARKMKNTKLEKKFLALMAQHGEDESTRMSAKNRLDYLNSHK